MATTDALRARRDELVAKLKVLALLPGDLDDAQRAAWNRQTTEVEQIDAQLGERAERASALTGRAVTADSGDGAAAYGGRNFNRGADQGDTLARAVDAGGANTRDGGMLLRDAARSAIDAWSDRSDVPPEWQASAEKIVSGSDRYAAGVAEYVAATSTAAYEQAFRNWLIGGPGSLMGDDATEFRRVHGWLASRAMNEGSVSAGQAAVPAMLDPLLVLSNAGQTSSWRQLATIKTITTQTWRGITTAGISAEWTAEAAEFTDGSPSLTQPQITPIKGDAYAQLSWELVEDSNLVNDLGMLFADARDRLEAAAFATGTGSTQPTGVCTALDLVTASRLSCTTASVVGVVDLYKMDSSLSPRWRRNAAWMGNKAVLNEIRQAVNTTIANTSPWVDFAGDMPSKAIGYPVFEASGLSNSTSSNTDCLLLADFRQFYIVDRLPTVMASTNWIMGANRRPTGETGVAMHFRVGSNVVVADAFRMLRR